MPQRSNGKLRVAAILDAAATVIAEKGYESATMAEIAARSGTKIGSLYRFFPNKESLADTLVVSARKDLDDMFDRFDAGVHALSIRALTDDLMALIFGLFTRPRSRETSRCRPGLVGETGGIPQRTSGSHRQDADDPFPKPVQEVRIRYRSRRSAQREGGRNAPGIFRRLRAWSPGGVS
ncbi:MAG: helix-turn-helix domain-containing protein [Ignavibacteriota bacterium]